MAVLLVVPFHSSMELPSSAWIDAFNALAGGVRMPLLMFICGLLTSRSSRVFDRVMQFSWMFIIWSTILHVAEVSFRGTALTSASIVSQLVQPTTAMWFVWAVAGMTVSLSILKKRPLLTLAVAAILSMLNDAVQVVGGNAFAYGHTLSHAVFFYVGAFYGSRLVAWVGSQGRSIIWLVPVLAALRLFDHFTVQSVGWQVLGLAERVVAICLALHLAAQLHRLPVIGAKLQEVGQNTLPFYVGHMLFVYVGVHLFGHLVPTWLAVAFVTVFALGGSIALYRASLVFGAHWLYRVPDRVVSLMGDVLQGRSRSTPSVSAGQLIGRSSLQRSQ
jgi:hypothetical protein